MKVPIFTICGGSGAQPRLHHLSQGRTRHGLDLEKRPAFLSCLALPRKGQRHVEVNHFLISSYELRYSLLVDKLKRDGISAIKLEATQTHFLSGVFVAVAVVGA